MKKLLITGCRGIPAQNGGFETFAEKLSLYLVNKDWDVTVYCQLERKENGGAITEEMWKGVRLVRIPVWGKGALATVLFDLLCMKDAVKRDGLLLTLGYNTAIFNLVMRMLKRQSVINLGGIEWRRSKWGRVAQLWLYLNEKIAIYAANHIVADHPEIKKHIVARGANPQSVSMIAYGGDALSGCDEDLIKSYGLKPHGYALVIARPEPENQIMEIIQAYTHQARNMPLIILGNYSNEKSYHRDVMRAVTNTEAKLLGGIYHRPTVDALRLYAGVYIHGHTVGGTNPSLVEALGAGNFILAHNNRFNRWVSGDAALYSKNKFDLDTLLGEHINRTNLLVSDLKARARLRHQEAFIWTDILGDYETMLEKIVQENVASEVLANTPDNS